MDYTRKLVLRAAVTAIGLFGLTAGTIEGNICVAVVGLLVAVAGVFAMEELNKNL